ncbi:type II toxin-antitoxin system RelB family antitoxin [Massilia violaceinigra]|uniref:type II toxin-antitoxin system RelB family antitoxin n=1 Tax=Massilia violaceinigra TaxID=2045208 RepID=UPI00351D08DE
MQGTPALLSRRVNSIAASRLLYYGWTIDKHLSPIASEFATVEQAEADDRWFRAKVLVSLDDQRPCAPRDEVMARMRVCLTHGPGITE